MWISVNGLSISAIFFWIYPLHIFKRFYYFQHFMIISTLWLSMCFIPLSACLVCSSSFDTISFSLVIWLSFYCAEQFFLFEINAKEQYAFLTLFPLPPHFFCLSKICVIFYLGFLLFIDSSGCSLKQLLKVAVCFWITSLSFTMTSFSLFSC